MPNQSKGTFPSYTQKNPKDCMAIQLRSGKHLSSNKRTERKEETKPEKEETEREEEKNTQIEQPKGSWYVTGFDVTLERDLEHHERKDQTL